MDDNIQIWSAIAIKIGLVSEMSIYWYKMV
jgi:hypothetical protein